MNKELREDLEHLIICKDKTITPDLRDDVKMTLDYIDELENKIEELNYKIRELDDMFYETFRISRDGYFSISEWQLKDFTNKVQELKGDVNNESN